MYLLLYFKTKLSIFFIQYILKVKKLIGCKVFVRKRACEVESADRGQRAGYGYDRRRKKKCRNRSSIQCDNIKDNASSSLPKCFQKKALVRQTHTTLPYHTTSLFLNTLLV